MFLKRSVVAVFAAMSDIVEIAKAGESNRTNPALSTPRLSTANFDFFPLGPKLLL
jgi:hypothetical protein